MISESITVVKPKGNFKKGNEVYIEEIRDNEHREFNDVGEVPLLVVFKGIKYCRSVMKWNRHT